MFPLSVSCFFSNSCPWHPCGLFSILSVLQTENVGAHICLFDIRGLRKPIAVNRQSKHPRGSILYAVKCATEATRASRTLRRVYTTPRGSHSRNVSDSYSEIPKFRISKNKAQHDAFYYVVLRPQATLRIETLFAGRYECKDTNYLRKKYN